ncbi:MAG: lytic transglycosylase [Candidatus Rokuibacteriota bacterium]|nr:MAG: lytic transglycosylase [Candidatus Rokubacteria bacterium]
MDGFGSRSLILLAVAATITTAVPVGAEMHKRAVPDGITSTRTDPSARMTVTPVATRASRRPSRIDDGAYTREIAEAAARHAVPERLIWAVIRAESGFDHRAVSRKGARGLMQLMPETAALLGVRDSFNPRENIDAGVRHLRGLIERFRSNLHLAIAAYNAGEGAVAAFGGVPPYPETREYVARVLRFYGMPIEWSQMQGSGIHQIIEPDGTIIYTNIPLRQFSAVSRGR